MNDVRELKQYVWAHARAQGVPLSHYEDLLSRITSDVDGADGSWTREWVRAGEALERDGKLLEAVQYYNLARFPFVAGPDRADALVRCVAAFDRWRREAGGIERVEVDTPSGRFGAWGTGLSTRDRKPLLVFTGGIVSIKEQWAPLLPVLRKLGVAAIAAELPGVGENPLPYDDKSHRLFSDLLDAVADRADVARTHLLPLSFSGHLALRCALGDERIRGLVTVGAPLREFFTDPAWWASLPRLTVDTLVHLTGVPEAGLQDHLRGWALTTEEIASLRLPVGYVACSRDEIIPPGDPALLREHAREPHVVEFDDVHGAPEHSREMQAWALLTTLRMLGGRRVPRALFGTVLAGQRLRRLLRSRA
ncbi:alpha/beta hydrolase [Amycolatopsis sp., V23-08]|uniref:Alpha/beta hydrolase n=1 Tax=Amycolatopsis heterodermiae TaxID=3110235 RepID=A0ABU5R2C6_9PSEU|nr:alpha/beta hydrolase [Amycolatopsis sp., V23-08]MEA5360357.1 alpha/beta hydrolase [Amycolatopsis sp., V23-08]